jgi:hypothetical protein
VHETREEPLGELAKRLIHDVNVLARDHVELAKVELTRGLRRAAVELAGLILGGFTALVGFALLCAAAVVALEPLIEPLWARMLLCSALYLAVGGLAVAVLMRRLKRDVTPDLPRTKLEARVTKHVLKEQVQHG